jgi:predicted ATPase
MRPLPTGTVTFLFSDIEGSTKLLDELGAEAYAQELAEHRRVMREAFAAHGGVEVDTQGDAFFVAFPDARGALDAAARAQQALAAGPIRVRMGIHSGHPLLTEEGYVGIDVHRGARVMSAGHGGQVLVSQTTFELLDGESGLTELGRHRLKDLTEPQPLYQLGESDFPPLKTLYQTNLPVQPTPLVGRDAELAEVLKLFGGTRLLTLTGAGGSGKTRLALQAAAELVEEYEDGVWWVSLAALRDPALVEPTIAQVVGAKDGLAEHLRARQALLLLDNCEQLLDAAPTIATLLAEASRLRVLVTSRERLALSAEQEYVVPTLVPTEAVALFTARARQLKPSFEPDEQVAEICRRLDGLPLALELAAARIKVLTPEQILDRLGDSLALLTGGARDTPERHQTLKATIAWSYELLSDPEKELFGHLAVFAGSFDFAAAEAICDADVDTVQALLDKSLLRQTDEGRFFMLETIFEYAAERLAHASDRDPLQARHALYFRQLAEEAETQLKGGPKQAAWLDRLEQERGNLRASLAWAEHADPELGLRLSAALVGFWQVRGPIGEARAWLATLLDRAGGESLELRARVLPWAADCALLQGDYEEAARLGEASLRVARQLDEPLRVGQALHDLAEVAFAEGEYERARELFEQAIATAREVGYPAPGAVAALGNLALVERQYERANDLFRRALALFREQSNPVGEAVALTTLATVERRLGRYSEALTLVEGGLRLGRQLAYEEVSLCSSLELAALLAMHDEAEEAALLLGAAEKMTEKLAVVLSVPDEQTRAETLAELQARLGEEACSEAIVCGTRMDPDEAIERGLRVARHAVVPTI